MRLMSSAFDLLGPCCLGVGVRLALKLQQQFHSLGAARHAQTIMLPPCSVERRTVAPWT